MLPPESLCDLCRENTASAHISRVVFGKTIQQYLCEICAGRESAATDPSNSTEKEETSESEPQEKRETVAEVISDSLRCPQCTTTWDRLRENGHAGCAQCYVTFEDQVYEVVAKLQFAPQHVGKSPQNALRRQRRLEDSRVKQIHRLEMLQRRLEEALATENYEEAAILRDKLIEIESSLVSPED